MRFGLFGFVAAAFATPAIADGPRVLVDIAPVHSIVSAVMEGVATPDLLLPGAASPHGYALRPSDARNLQEADLLVWVGPELTPWLAEAQETLSAGGTSLPLLGAEGTVRLTVRDALTFETAEDSDHGDHDHADDHAHDHGDDQKEDHASSDDDDHGEAHDHEEHSVDPHAWLSPDNAAHWAAVVAKVLSDQDPENAAIYAGNAKDFANEIAVTVEALQERLDGSPVRGVAVYHDAFQYFETSFGIDALTSLTTGDAAQPSVARAAILRDALETGAVACVFAEPQFAERALRSIADGSDAVVAVLDPLGADLEPGPALYTDLLSDIASAVEGCR